MRICFENEFSLSERDREREGGTFLIFGSENTETI